MERRSGRTNSASRCRGVSIIRLVGRRPEPLLRRGLGKSDPPLLLYRLERFCFGSFQLWRHPDLAGGRGSRAGLGRASSSGLLFQQSRSKNARLSPLFDVVEGLNRKIFRPTVFIRMISRSHIHQETRIPKCGKTPVLTREFA